MSKKDNYSDVSNAETRQNFLTAEEFPEGPVGSPRHKDDPVKNKETPWEEGQQFYSNFAYEYRNFHENLPRQYPDAHHTHDDPKTEKEKPYDNYTPD
ncbi:hypothetical protein PU629_05250 [Pullulanibacillus sp. KACC 23026]|uniref:hypothetical protein n=1 Tax=Pullulanibacillus sp. KACC 23026 TaxID=3028315 RepID=UPI0023B0DAF4|nr:hypothetical protein [Pullulanibacillus sp. KACC 23026]WEG13775.1 hypothetical protein PU629_05250 [Pullulanibacillus sp. KACC 23026]